MATKLDRSTEQTFRTLVDQWRAETEFTSSVQRRVMHPAYQRIIGLGASAVPLLLRELKTQPDHWFWALQAITSEDPVPSGASFDQAVAAWIAWGKARSLLT